MKLELVPFEIAVELKEKGFNTHCICKYFLKKPSGYYIKDWSKDKPYRFENIYSSLSLGYKNQEYFIWCPEIDLVIKWLREVHKIDISIRISTLTNEYKAFIPNFITGDYESQYYNTYEQAQIAGIKEALKLI